MITSWQIGKVVWFGNRDLAKEREVCSMPTASPARGAPEKEQMQTQKNCSHFPAEPVSLLAISQIVENNQKCFPVNKKN